MESKARFFFSWLSDETSSEFRMENVCFDPGGFFGQTMTCHNHQSHGIKCTEKWW